MSHYTLYLQNGLGEKFYLSRTSIRVEESSDFETLAQDDQACGLCTLNGKRTFKFKLYFIGNCSLASAWALFNLLQTYLNDNCTSSDVILYRRVQDEPFLEYKVTKATLRMVDVTNQYVRERILTMEFNVDLTVWDPDGAVVIG